MSIKNAALTAIGFLLLTAAPLVLSVIDEPFYIEVITRMMTFALAAMSLGLILGFGGMVSFGHAAFVGIGAYAVGILSFHGIHNGILHFVAAGGSAALVAVIIGALCLQTAGLYFIMITLAFSQMIYFLVVSLDLYGGNFGMNLSKPSQFFDFIDFEDPITFYYTTLSILVIFFLLGAKLVNSKFGRVIRGAKSNEMRMTVIGFPVFRYKLTAFIISSAVAGVSGALMANQALYVSPDLMAWTRSGELLIAVILGGMGSLAGPIVGAFALLIIEDLLKNFTGHVGVILGPVLILVVLFARGGLLGLIQGTRDGR